MGESLCLNHPFAIAPSEYTRSVLASFSDLRAARDGNIVLDGRTLRLGDAVAVSKYAPIYYYYLSNCNETDLADTEPSSS
jgi:hypothetical protein